MIISRLALTNWRNFRSADVALGRRVFVIGPNASGKSNFLDVFRFLRDIVKPGGGLQEAVLERGGVSKIRCLAARRDPLICIDVHFSESPGGPEEWRYELGIKQEGGSGLRQTQVKYERVWHGEKKVLDRPDEDDIADPLRLSETHLQQVNANKAFREIHAFFGEVAYLHLIPQLLRYPEAFSSYRLPGDPFGGLLLNHIVEANKKTRVSRLRKIERALRLAVPQLKELKITQDGNGIPHLEAIYEHWREHGAKQNEAQFSDGTLRLIGLLWSLLNSDSLLLLEEPELSLHPALVSQIPGLMHRLQSKKKRQVIISTHSIDLLKDQGIGGEEVLLLIPGSEGTSLRVTSDVQEIRTLLESGLTVAEAAFPKTVPPSAEQLGLFE